MAKSLTISVRSHIKLEDIENLLDSASRGAGYWADSDQLGFESTVKRILNGGSERIRDTEEEKDYFLTLKSIKHGLTVMAKKQPSDFADFLKGDYDQNTGDIFLQCCLLGEVIYG